MKWIVHLESGQANDEDRQAFQAWLDLSAVHRRAYNQILAVWQGAAMVEEIHHIEPRHLSNEEIPNSASRKILHILKPGRPLRSGAIAAGVFALFMIVGVALVATLLSPATQYQTQIAEIRDLVLPDNSNVTLGANSQITLEFTDTERQVILNRGEAFFSVSKDPLRPFLVLAQDTVIRVTGTKFNVHHAPRKVIVSVLEGKVEVAKTFPKTPVKARPESQSLALSIPATEFQPVKAGQQLESEYNKPLRKIIAQPRRKPDAWLKGHLVYNYATLREVIADANRYSHIPIVIEPEDVGDLKVTAAFRTDQIDQMIEALSDALPIKVIHDPGRQVRITTKPQ